MTWLRPSPIRFMALSRRITARCWKIGQTSPGLAVHLRSAASQAEDLLLVYFVGHGLVAPRHDLYLGLPDSDLAEPEFNSLEYDKLRSAVLDSAAATKIIILDCCFSGRVVSEARQIR